MSGANMRLPVPEDTHGPAAGNPITEFLFPAPAKRTVGSIIGWWEKRRLPYNLIVGAAGLVPWGLSALFSALLPAGTYAGIPWQGVVVFGLAANVFYLLGPTVEILIHKIWGRELLPTGPVLYRMGLTFSLGLVLLPTLFILVGFIARIVFAIF